MEYKEIRRKHIGAVSRKGSRVEAALSLEVAYEADESDLLS